jgi:hypothetical protein
MLQRQNTDELISLCTKFPMVAYQVEGKETCRNKTGDKVFLLYMARFQFSLVFYHRLVRKCR